MENKKANQVRFEADRIEIEGHSKSRLGRA
jgi:hypothetical protein